MAKSNQKKAPPPLELEWNPGAKPKQQDDDQEIEVQLPDGTSYVAVFPSGMSEKDIEQAIHEAHPELSENKAPKQDEKTTIFQDLMNSLKSAPGAFSEMISQAPEVISQGAEQLVNDPLRFAENLGSGALEVPKNLWNAPLVTGEYLASKDIPFFKQLLPAYKALQIGDTGLQRAIMGEQKPEDRLAQMLGGSFPIGKLAGLTGGLGGTTRRAAALAAPAAGEHQDPVHAALMAIAPEMAGKLAYEGGRAVGKGAQNIGNKLDPAQMFRGYLTPEELDANLRAAEGTETPLGRVLENPNLNRFYENTVATTPLSGALETQHGTRQAIEQSGKNVLETIQPEGAEGDLNYVVQQLIKLSAKKEKDLKNKLYRKRNLIAEYEGHRLNLNEFYNMVNEDLEAIKESPVYKTDPRFRKTFNDLVGFEQIQKGKPPTITEATSMQNMLDDAGKSFSSSANSSDRFIGSMFNRLAYKLKDDIESSIEHTGSPELKAAHQEANENYAQNYSALLTPEMRKLLKESHDPQKIIREIIKPGKANDMYTQIERVNDLFPAKQKHLLGYAYLQGALDQNGKLDPKRLAQFIKNLGPRQMKALYPDKDIRQMLEDFGNLRGMNEEALNSMFNPKTGHKTVAHAKAAAMIAAIWAGGLPALAAGSTVAAMRLGNYLMTNEKFRNWLVKRMKGQNVPRPKIILPNDPRFKNQEFWKVMG